MKFRLLLCLAGTLAACQPSDPELRVADRLVWSEAPTLVAKGLETGDTYTLQTERISQWSDTAAERSVLTYVADDRGRIDTSRQLPSEVEDAAKATWSYLPLRDMAYLRDTPLDGLSVGQMRFQLTDTEGATVLSRIVGIGPDREALVEEPFDEAFQGAYIMKRADRSGLAPAIVLLGGSEGNDTGSRSVAPILAAEGYTVLGLPYYSPVWGGDAKFPDLPAAFADIPVDYLEEAVAELRRRPDVDPDRIMLEGGSKGAEFVLLAGSLIPDDSPGGGFCGIVANVPSDVVWEGWGAGQTVSSFSWRDEPLPFVPYTDMNRVFDPEDDYSMTEAHENGRRDNPDRAAEARIKVERIDEPVLLIGGDKDTTWASGPMARAIKATRDAAGLETESYTYPEAGHGVGGTPLVRTRSANLEARLENFPATMAFLERVSQRDDCRG